MGSPYAIVVSDATGGTFTSGNYTISYVNGALTVTPAAVVPPVIVPPVVVPPPLVVVPPVVVVPPIVPPVVLEPDVVPVVIPPSEVSPPVVPPIVTDPVVEPNVVTPLVVAPVVIAPVSVVNGKQTMPRDTGKDASPALLVVVAHPRVAQGPVMFPATADPVLQQEKPPLRLRVLPVRPPKQDRN